MEYLVGCIIAFPFCALIFIFVKKTCLKIIDKDLDKSIVQAVNKAREEYYWEGKEWKG